jgi:hypothetical protein
MKINERIFDATTGETTDIERDETAQEIELRLKYEADIAAAAAEAEAAAIAKADILNKLGITEDEAKLLLG